MKPLGSMLIIVLTLFSMTSAGFAGDFDWTRDFNIQAEADPSGFRARIGGRFHVGDMEINAVLGNVEKPSDAYVLLSLGEMSDQPIDQVIKTYKDEKSKGWGALAKSLGIKPGSTDFQALKQGQDLYDGKNNGKEGSKSKGKVKNKGKGKK